jgi:hypothetical protein
VFYRNVALPPKDTVFQRRAAPFLPVVCLDEVIGFFSIDLILPAALGPGVYSASNRNEYQELIK